MKLETDISTLSPGKRLRAIRIHRGLSQTALSQQTGVDISLISRVENEWLKRPGKRFRRLMSEALGVQISDIWGDG